MSEKKEKYSLFFKNNDMLYNFDKKRVARMSTNTIWHDIAFPVDLGGESSATDRHETGTDGM